MGILISSYLPSASPWGKYWLTLFWKSSSVPSDLFFLRLATGKYGLLGNYDREFSYGLILPQSGFEKILTYSAMGIRYCFFSYISLSFTSEKYALHGDYDREYPFVKFSFVFASGKYFVLRDYDRGSSFCYISPLPRLVKH